MCCSSRDLEMKLVHCWRKIRRKICWGSDFQRSGVLPPVVATVGWRLISITCIEEMRNSSNRKVRIAHDNMPMIIAWLKGDWTSASLAGSPRRLIYYLVKAPSRFTRWRLIISIPLAKSWKSAVFPRYFKNRKWYRGIPWGLNVMCP